MLKKILFSCSVIFLLLGNSAIPGSADVGKDDSKEIELGRKVAVQVEQKWERISDPAETARTDMLLQRLLPMLHRNLPYEVRLIREDSPNAFSLPGGIIFVTSGMLSFAHSDSEIAAILSHELIHAQNGHVMKQIARNQRISLVALAIMVASRGQAAPAILANVMQVAVSNSYSIDLEKEADIGGIEVLEGVGFPPAAMVTVMEGLAEEQLKHPYIDPGIYMDHPETSERVSYLLEYIRNKGWPLERKLALNVLKCKVLSDIDSNSLFIDDNIIIQGPPDGDTKNLLNGIASKLDRNLQLEMAPYDIQVIRLPDSYRALRVGNVILISEPLHKGLPELDVIRENLVKALLNAKNVHPTVDFMK